MIEREASHAHASRGSAGCQRSPHTVLFPQQAVFEQWGIGGEGKGLGATGGQRSSEFWVLRSGFETDKKAKTCGRGEG